MKPHFDLAVVLPLAEEFETALTHFKFIKDLSTATRVRFEVSVEGSDARLLLVKQNHMGRTDASNATMDILEEFEVGLLVCLGIAGGLSSDVCIGDVCRTGAIIDLLDNAKVTDVASPKKKSPGSRSSQSSGQKISFSPTHYDTPTEIGVALDLDKLVPERKEIYATWAAERAAAGKVLIPGEFTGKDAKRERIEAPTVRSGMIACAAVSDSVEYNDAIKKLDRKILAIETESGGIFTVANRYSVPVLTIRGISDYAGSGVDKNRFEAETDNKARLIAVSNATSYLYQQIQNPRFDLYLKQRRSRSPSSIHGVAKGTVDVLGDLLVSQSEFFNSKLKELAPGFSLQGYRIPIPRICIRDPKLADTGVPFPERALEMRDALRRGRVLIIEVPPQYPDRSLAWIIARDLLSLQLSQKQALPNVIEARDLHIPNRGIDAAAHPLVLSFKNDPQVQIIFVVNEFDFSSRTQTQFLLEQVNNLPNAKFVVVTKNRSNIVSENQFARKTGPVIAYLDDVSFAETSHFLQKNFEMTGPEAEVVAVRLRETFSKYKLTAHPSYFAGIPATTLSALLRANKRAELIELAVAGYLSFVVAQDDEPLTLSRKTREAFLTLLAFELKVNKRSFTEAELVKLTSEYAREFDYKISAVRFYQAFVDNGILFVDGDKVRFTLPFMEAYLLARKLHLEPKEALKYFQYGVGDFDISTFMLYSEIGIADELVADLSTRLDLAISSLNEIVKSPSVLISNQIQPAMLAKSDRVRGMQTRLQRAISDVTNDNDATHDKQRLLDAADKIRKEASSQSRAEEDRPERQSVESNALEVWSVSVMLLGAGVERLQAGVKRSLIEKILRLSAIILDDWTRVVGGADFDKIRKDIVENKKLINDLAKSQEPDDLAEAERMAEGLVDLLEFSLQSHPFRVIVQTLCEEARDAVLAESIKNTEVEGVLEELLRCIWLSDLDASAGVKKLNAAVKALPNANFLRINLASHLNTRVYWNHWDKESRLKLLNSAQECLKSSGLQYDKAGLKRLIEQEKSSE
jgi:nucleoside phosphorylase